MQAPLLQAAMRRPTAQLLAQCISKAPAATRTFSHLPTLRPSLSAPRPIFRQPTSLITAPFQPTTTTPSSMGGSETVLDLVPKTSISSHPALAGAGSQIRCGPRPTMRGASRLVQKRRHGFLSRVKTQNGRKTIARRRAKGRKKLGH